MLETPIADLHVHTTRSDGTIDPEAISTVAQRAGLHAIAITDHDQLPPIDGPIETIDGIDVIGGIEFRVKTDQLGRVDLLGYGVRRTPALAAAIDRLQHNRIERARKIVDRLEATLDRTIDIDIDVGVGRPHIARAVADQTALSPQDVFDRYIGNEKPCYVARDIPTIQEGRKLLRFACSFVVLAHPLRYGDVERAVQLATTLDGIEYRYPYDNAVDQAALDHALSGVSLLKTGGSDAHDVESVGTVGLTAAEYRPIAQALCGSEG